MASTIDGMNPTKNKIELSQAIFSIAYRMEKRIKLVLKEIDFAMSAHDDNLVSIDP